MQEDSDQIARELGVHPDVTALQTAPLEHAAAGEVDDEPGHLETERRRRVVIVTPVHNRKAITLQCLRSLSRIDRTGLDVHIIVVDDGSTDGTGDAIRREFPEVEVVEGDGNLYYTKGTNLGMRVGLQRNPDYILTINDDSLFHREFLVRMVDCAQRHPRSVIGALLLRWDAPNQIAQYAPRWDTWSGGWTWPQNLTVQTVPQGPVDVELIPGNCVLLPRAAVQQEGLMNERAFPYGWGDAEYTSRLRKGGWRLLIESGARVWVEPNLLTPKAPLSQMPRLAALRELLADRRSHRNLVQTFFIYWHVAPSRWKGVVAFIVRLTRLGLKALGMRRASHSENDPEAKDWSSSTTRGR